METGLTISPVVAPVATPVIQNLQGGVGVGSIYEILGFEPKLVADFDDEYYRANGGATTFSDLITHSRAGQATMTDSDGLIKWAPHNLVTYSEQFESVNWVKAASSADDNQGVAPDGTSTAALVAPNVGTVNAYITQASVGTDGLPFTMALWVKSDGATWVRLTNKSAAANKAYFNLSTGTIGTVVGGSASIADAGDGWYLIKFNIDSWQTSASDYIFGITDADNTVTHTSDGTNKAYIWGAHTYRSDLGGMVDNPDRGDSYVPTTSSSVYLPRRGHHVYNGSEFVNEGVLAESEARTNLVTYSDDLTTWTTVGTATASSGIEVLGVDSTLVDFGSPSGGANRVALNTTITGSTVYTFSAIIKPLSNIRGVNLRVFCSGGTSKDCSQDFDVVDGLAFGASNNVIDTFVQELSDGIYRVGFSFISETSNTTGNVRIGAPIGYTNTNDQVYVIAAQLEAGSTPSSYIPTSGSTATRAAETFTIPSAKLPWPTPQYIGDELVTNGDFNDGTTGWLTTAGATLSVVDGELIVSGDGVSAYGRAFQPLTTSVGSVYSLTFDFTKTVSNLILTAGAVDLATISSSGTYTYTFVATNTTTSIIFKIQNDANGELTLDNISVREINPLSVSIQMDGRMTYADEDNVAQVERVYWYANSNNYIRLELLQTVETLVSQPLLKPLAERLMQLLVQLTLTHQTYLSHIILRHVMALRSSMVQ